MPKIENKTCKDCYWSEWLHDGFTCCATKWYLKTSEKEQACTRFEPFKYRKTYFADVVFNDYLSIDDVPNAAIEEEIIRYKKLQEKHNDYFDYSFLKMSLEEQKEVIFKSATKTLYTFSSISTKELSNKINAELKKHKCILSIKIYRKTIKHLLKE